MKKEIKENWEKEFKKEFGIHFSKSELQFALCFIKELLEKEKEGWVEGIKEIRIKHRNECDYDYCDAEDLLTDLIKKIKET